MVNHLDILYQLWPLVQQLIDTLERNGIGLNFSWAEKAYYWIPYLFYFFIWPLYNTMNLWKLKAEVGKLGEKLEAQGNEL